MAKKRLRGFKYQKKLVDEFRKKMEDVHEYTDASIYTILFDLVLSSDINEVKMVLADLEQDIIVDSESGLKHSKGNFEHRIRAEMEGYEHLIN